MAPGQRDSDNMNLRIHTTLVVVLVATASFSACGSSGSPAQEHTATEPSNEDESSDQPSEEETASDEEEAVSACLEAPPAKTKFKVTVVREGPFVTYDPRKVKVPAGKQITIEFSSDDHAPHSFTLDSPDCDTGAVDNASVTFTAPLKPVQFYCTFHEFMTGKLMPTG